MVKQLASESKLDYREPKNPAERSLRVRYRKTLPMIFEEDGKSFNVLACPDTGSYENIMSLETAQRLGVPIERLQIENEVFCTANGQVVMPIGKTVAKCSFAIGTSYTGPATQSVFHVFKTLPAPIIMGRNFLERTETWTKHRNRLVDEAVPIGQSPRVFSIGRHMRGIACILNRRLGQANIDTGSDLNFVSESFARTRGFDPDEECHKVMFADGSCALTRGTFHVNFAVGVGQDSYGFSPTSQAIVAEFHVLPGLSSDILIGQDIVEQLDIFASHHESFVTETSPTGESEVCIIRYIGKVEKWIREKLRKRKQSPASTCACRSRYLRPTANSPTPLLGHDMRREWELEDQRENARREAYEERVVDLIGAERDRAEADERIRRRQYELKKMIRVTNTSTATQRINNFSRSDQCLLAVRQDLCY